MKSLNNFSDLVGHTLKACYVVGHHEELYFELTDGRTYKLHHQQDYCESVLIEDIVGDLNDLVGSPILTAHEASSDVPTLEQHAADRLTGRDKERTSDESQTWTFYKLATIKGYVDVRWYGSSNGYCSESVYWSEA